MSDDVVAELDAWLDRWRGDGLMQRARDEILVLREEYETMKGAFEGLSQSIRAAVAESVRVAQVRIRNEALEEAVQACTDQTSDDPPPGTYNDACEDCAAAIRALKEKH